MNIKFYVAQYGGLVAIADREMYRQERFELRSNIHLESIFNFLRFLCVLSDLGGKSFLNPKENPHKSMAEISYYFTVSRSAFQ